MKSGSGLPRTFMEGDPAFSLPFMGRVAGAVRPKPGGGGEVTLNSVAEGRARRVSRHALPTRSSLRADHPPPEGEGEVHAQNASAGICISTSAPDFSFFRCAPASGRMRSTK